MRFLWQRLTADRKRFGLFCTLLFVGLLLWARIIVIARPPRTAVAVPIDQQVAAIPTPSDNVPIPVFLDTRPKKNPFSMNQDVFPNLDNTTDNTVYMPVNNSVKTEQEIVAGLTLDAVIGEMAMINGRVVKLGEVVVMRDVPNPLKLTELSGRSVIISAGNRRYELTIAPPSR